MQDTSHSFFKQSQSKYLKNLIKQSKTYALMFFVLTAWLAFILTTVTLNLTTQNSPQSQKEIHHYA